MRSLVALNFIALHLSLLDHPHQRWLGQMRQTVAPANFEPMSSGYRLEIEKMQAAMIDYLLHPIERADDKQPV